MTWLRDTIARRLRRLAGRIEPKRLNEEKKKQLPERMSTS